MADKGLSNENILVSFHAGCASGVKKSKKATAQLAELNNAEAGSVSGNLKTFSVGIKPVKDHSQLARNHFGMLTLGWGDDGKRLTNNAVWEGGLRKSLEDFKVANEKLMREFISNYEYWMDDAKKRLGTLHDPADWKSPDELMDKWYFHYDIAVVPDPERDVRAGWSPNQLQRIKKDWEAGIERKMEKAQKEVFERCKDVVGKVSDRMESYDGGQKGSFHDTLITNVREFADILPAFNFNHSSEMEEFQKKLVKDLASVDPTQLRNSPELREKTKTIADDLLKRIGSFGSK
tara:strand:+ start:2630 stop:3502 length:873 start_codon:yes stop_codon:yes gene_type:complete